ncbi:MAG: glycosyltransferase [Clostridiales bacterium]|nr:glycosyltransferase [Clostridiales bacterium]
MISVIVPVYNAGEYLEACIDSVLSQTYGNLELILIDDGSTDGSGELCDAFAERDTRIKVIHRENGGVSRARNMGLDAARGDVIAFLDCDDYILPGMYEAMIDRMDKAKAKIAVCTVIDEQENGDVRRWETGETMLITGRDALRKLVTGMGDRAGHRETIWFSVWNKLYDAGIFKSGVRFDPETDSAEDVPVNLAAFAMADHILYYERPYYFWRYRRESQSNLRAPKALRGGTRTSRYLFDCAKTLGERDRPAAVTAAIRHFYWYYTGGVYALSQAKKWAKEGGAGGAEYSREDYISLRDEMRASLKAIASDPAYRKYTAGSFKAAVWLILHIPALFGAMWLFYRRLKRL